MAVTHIVVWGKGIKLFDISLRNPFYVKGIKRCEFFLLTCLYSNACTNWRDSIFWCSMFNLQTSKCYANRFVPTFTDIFCGSFFSFFQGKGCIKMKICTLMNEKKNGEMMKENVKWWIWNDKQQFLPHFYSCEFAINISSEMNDAWFDRWCKIKFITHALSRTLNIIRTISAFIVISWSNGEQFYA